MAPLRTRIRTIEQLRTLKAMRVLDRFTVKKLAAIAGIPAATVRSLFCRWEKEEFYPVAEVGVERSLSAGQPSKVYALADGMAAVIDALIQDGDYLALPDLANPAAEPLRRMNLLDAATEMVDAAERSARAEDRDKLVAEARSLVERSRATLVRRKAAGRGGASPNLDRDLQSTEDRISRLIQPAAPQDDVLKIIVENRATELAKSAPGNRDWLTALAKHYVHTGPSGRDAEVGFFGGFLVARGEMGTIQNTPLDEWLFERRRDGSAADLSWTDLEAKFAAAFGRLIEEGSRRESWRPLVQKCLAGVEKNAELSVIPAIHLHVASLIESTSSDDLRESASAFLQRYACNVTLMQRSAARSHNRNVHEIDSYFDALALQTTPKLPPDQSPARKWTMAWAPFAAKIDQFQAVFGSKGHRGEPVVAMP
jgi:hypothetical protein